MTTRTNRVAAVTDGDLAIVELEVVPLAPLNLLRNYNGISEEEIYVSN